METLQTVQPYLRAVQTALAAKLSITKTTRPMCFALCKYLIRASCRRNLFAMTSHQIDHPFFLSIVGWHFRFQEKFDMLTCTVSGKKKKEYTHLPCLWVCLVLYLSWLCTGIPSWGNLQCSVNGLSARKRGEDAGRREGGRLRWFRTVKVESGMQGLEVRLTGWFVSCDRSMFKCLIHFEVIFVYNINRGLNHIHYTTTQLAIDLAIAIPLWAGTVIMLPP